MTYVHTHKPITKIKIMSISIISKSLLVLLCNLSLTSLHPTQTQATTAVCYYRLACIFWNFI